MEEKDIKNGSIHERSQVYNPVPEQLVMRDRTGKFMMINSDGNPFKWVKGFNNDNILLIDHDKENKTLFLRWADGYKESIGFKNYVLDLNKNREIIGIEILNFDGGREYNMEKME